MGNGRAGWRLSGQSSYSGQMRYRDNKIG
jgi:hypothetical protein